VGEGDLCGRGRLVRQERLVKAGSTCLSENSLAKRERLVRHGRLVWTSENLISAGFLRARIEALLKAHVIAVIPIS
jgi:hypothetical protein